MQPGQKAVTAQGPGSASGRGQEGPGTWREGWRGGVRVGGTLMPAG